LQKDLFIDVTYQDSNEEPEIDWVNTIVSIKPGNKIYQYFNQNPKVALNKFKSMLEATITFLLLTGMLLSVFTLIKVRASILEKLKLRSNSNVFRQETRTYG